MRETEFLSYRARRIGFIVIMIIITVLLIPVLFIDSYLSSTLSDKLKTAILKSSDGLYHIDMSKVELHVLQGKAVLYNVVLLPDTAIYRKMKFQGIAPNNVYQLQVKELYIAGAHPFRLYFHKKLDIADITLDNPELQISQYGNKHSKPSSKDNLTLYQKISKDLKSIHIGGIHLNAINFTYRNYLGEKPAVSILKKMDLKAIDLLIDSTTQADTLRTLYCKDIATELRNFRGQSASGLYRYSFESVHLSTLTSKIKVVGITVKPLLGNSFFAKTNGDRFTLHLDSATFNRFDFESYKASQALDISKLTVYHGDFEVYSNPNSPPSKTDRVVTFPHLMIRKIKFGINIDTLDVKGINVTYTEYNKDALKAGSVKFLRTAGRFLNITNQQESLSKNNICSARLSTMLMGKGKLDVAFFFNLNDATYNYSYQGHLGPMDLQAGNSALMPLSLVKITSGTVKSLSFNIHSTQKVSTGTVNCLYNNLKVEMLKSDGTQGYHKKQLVSLVANLAVLKKDNPDDGNSTPRLAKVIYIRPSSYPFFETLWMTLLNGIKPNVGMGPAKDKQTSPAQIQNDNDKLLKKAEQRKHKEDKEVKKQIQKKKS